VKKIMSEPKTVSLAEIGQISVNVHDVDRAIAFYKDVLGMNHLFTVPGRMAFFDCSGIRLMLAIPERPDLDHPSSILYFKVQDIGAAHEALVSRKVHFETKPMLVAPMATHDLWLAEFRDSENNVLALMCEKPRRLRSELRDIPPIYDAPTNSDRVIPDQENILKKN
jgi:methylmalonyl-CoA/ethylmalonyl-CoA epimerase